MNIIWTREGKPIEGCPIPQEQKNGVYLLIQKYALEQFYLKYDITLRRKP